MLKDVGRIILAAQKNEITEYHIYRMLAQSIKDASNRDVLKRISNEELKHYEFWRKYTNRDMKLNRLTIWKYLLISRFLG